MDCTRVHVCFWPFFWVYWCLKVILSEAWLSCLMVENAEMQVPQRSRRSAEVKHTSGWVIISYCPLGIIQACAFAVHDNRVLAQSCKIVLHLANPHGLSSAKAKISKEHEA